MSTAHDTSTEMMYTRIVDELRGRLFSASELAVLTGVSERQVQRWASGASKPDGDSRTKLLEVRYVIDQLRDVYTDDGIEIWLHGRNRGLGSRRPIELLEQGQIEPLLELIEQLHIGAM